MIKHLPFLVLLISFSIKAQVVTLVKNINPATSHLGAYPYNSSFATNYFAFNGKTFFTAADSVNRGGLWAMDSATGSQPYLLDIKPQRKGLGSAPNSFVILQNRIYYTDVDTNQHQVIAETDGTQQGTKIMADVVPGTGYLTIANLTVFNGMLAFSVNDGVHGYELWISDGTQGGTHLLRDIVPGLTASYPSTFVVYNSKLCFMCNDSIHGKEPWISDGTANGTVLLKDIAAGAGGSDGEMVGVFNNHLLFHADDLIHGNEVWASDGTPGGTIMLKDFSAINLSPSFYSIIPNGSVFYFNVYNKTSTLFDTWQSDGTQSGTVAAGGFVGLTGGEFAGGTRIGNRFYFIKNTVPKATIFYTDDAQTDRGNIGTYFYDAYGIGPHFIVGYHNKIYYVASDSLYPNLLWESDGTKAGSHEVMIPSGYLGNGDIVNTAPAECNNRLFFTADYDTTIGFEPYTFTTPGNDNTFAPVLTADKGGLSVYPNPSNGNFNVSFRPDKNATGRMELINILGAKIIDEPVQFNTGNNSYYIKNVEGMQGVYFLKIASGGNEWVSKVVIN